MGETDLPRLDIRNSANETGLPWELVPDGFPALISGGLSLLLLLIYFYR
jgi:hypothetical protein